MLAIILNLFSQLRLKCSFYNITLLRNSFYLPHLAAREFYKRLVRVDRLQRLRRLVDGIDVIPSQLGHLIGHVLGNGVLVHVNLVHIDQLFGGMRMQTLKKPLI